MREISIKTEDGDALVKHIEALDALAKAALPDGKCTGLSIDSDGVRLQVDGAIGDDDPDVVALIEQIRTFEPPAELRQPEPTLMEIRTHLVTMQQQITALHDTIDKLEAERK